MEDTSKTAPIVNSAPPNQYKATEAAQRAWTVNFVVPAPESMPSERLKARAELVRRALSSTSY